jgi:predicted nucleotidyltransferase
MSSGDALNIDLTEIRNYLAEAKVTFAVLFGSHARDTESESSDIDVALRFSDEMDDYERFHLRNRISAELQQHADAFVDVSDLDSLPLPVAHAALRDGVYLVGDERTVEAYRERVKAEYEATAEKRKREHEEFIDRLARGDV